MTQNEKDNLQEQDAANSEGGCCNSTCGRCCLIFIKIVLFIILFPIFLIVLIVFIVIWLVTNILKCCSPCCAPCFNCLTDLVEWMVEQFWHLIRWTCGMPPPPPSKPLDHDDHEDAEGGNIGLAKTDENKSYGGAD